MNRFMEWLKNNKYYALLTLMLMFLLVPMTVTLGKYVKDQPVGEFSLEVKAEPAILKPGSDFRGIYRDDTTDVVLGYTRDYAAEIEGLTGTNISTENKGWAKYYYKDGTLYVLSNRRIFANENCDYMFSPDTRKVLTSISSITLDNFRTDLTTTMSHMFDGCSGLTSLDVSGWKTSQVRDMSYLFYECSRLSSLDVSGFDTSNVTNMSHMFCLTNPHVHAPESKPNTALTSLDVSGFDTSKVTDMSYMFTSCAGVSSLDVSGFDTSKVTDMSYMFSLNPYSNQQYRPALTSLNVSGFDTSKVTNMVDMFEGCSSLTSLDVSGFDTSNVTLIGGMFEGCSSLTSLDVSGFDTRNVTNMASMFLNCSSLISLDVSGFDTRNVTAMFSMFLGCSSLTSLDISAFDTSKVTGMSYMFEYCRNLTTIYVSSGWTVNKVAQSSEMFSGCSKLVGGAGTTYSRSKDDKTYARIDGGPDSATPGYFTDIADKPMFYDLITGTKLQEQIYYSSSCPTTIVFGKTKDYAEQISGISGTAVDAEGAGTIMTYTVGKTMYILSDGLICANADSSRMFEPPIPMMTTPTDIVFSNFNTSNVTNMSSMFSSCRNLTTLDVSGWDTSKVTNMNRMFYNCSKLTSLDVSGWNTGNVTDMGSMFYQCTGLTTLDVSKWDTSKVTDMYYMFYTCTRLTSLDLSGWNTGNVTRMNFMFYNCKVLTTIYVGSGWSTAAVTDSSAMLHACTNLKGGAGTVYNSSYTNKEYARIDGGPDSDTPGYFTDKAAGAAELSMEDTPSLDQVTEVPMPYDLITGSSLNAAIKNEGSVTAVVFGKTADYAAQISGIHGTAVDAENAGKIMLYDVPNADGTTCTAYLLSDGIICANADSSAMFKGCNAVTSIVFSNFQTGNITDMTEMFSGCSGLTALDVSGWNTSRVTGMNAAFYGCSKLTALDVLGWNTANVTDMGAMFGNCSNLTALDLSGWNTANVTNMSEMFYNCSKLTTIYAGSGWSTNQVGSNSIGMFNSCTNLQGGAGTVYNSSCTDKEYARIDSGPDSDAPGYFTDKSSVTAEQSVEDTPSSDLATEEPEKPNETEEDTLPAEPETPSPAPAEPVEPGEPEESSKDSNEDSKPTETGEVSEPEDSGEESQPIESSEIPESEAIPSQEERP